MNYTLEEAKSKITSEYLEKHIKENFSKELQPYANRRNI